MTPAIAIERLGKVYQIGQRRENRTAREAIMSAMGAPMRNFRKIRRLHSASRTGGDQLLWALRNVTFDVVHGEVVGIVGRNGSGKSTLLKILSRIVDPTEGRARIAGRVGSLLEVGTGFHPELTGRDNVFLNGSILGMGRAEIRAKFDEIVHFSGVSAHIDTPVKRYSSGMQVRLAFAVAAHFEPEILIVDEVLAVGDLSFQEKCIGKMGELAGGGRTVLFVSHNMAAVAALCSRACWLNDGQLVADGPAAVVVDRYIELSRGRTEDGGLVTRRDRSGSGAVRATDFRLLDGSGDLLGVVRSGGKLQFAIDYAAAVGAPVHGLTVHLIIAGPQGQRLFSCMSDVTNGLPEAAPPRGRITCTIDELPLLPGPYDVHLSIHAGRQLADKLYHAATFVVGEGDFYNTGRLPPASAGDFLVRNTWNVEE